tara:strand:- start:88 stop:495 length:408 start_codon:yes stop_codon:yes gene_type:complete
MKPFLVSKEIAENLKKIGFKEKTNYFMFKFSDTVHESAEPIDHNSEGMLSIPTIEHAQAYLSSDHNILVIWAPYRIDLDMTDPEYRSMRYRGFLYVTDNGQQKLKYYGDVQSSMIECMHEVMYKATDELADATVN